MNENPRIAELRRRVEKDPSSIAFAQLAEEYRRTGDFQQAVKVCREGLARHPGYLSAQVTLGRALMELAEYEDADKELQGVLQVAPDNLAAIRALAEIHQRRGDVPERIDVVTKIEVPKPEPAPLGEPEPAPLGEPEPAQEPEPVQEPEPLVATEPEPLVATEPEPLLDLDMPPPLEQAAPLDVSLDMNIPTFEEVKAPEPVAPAEISFEVPGQVPPPSEEDLPSLEALDALTLDLPPMPDFSNWTLDTDLALDLPEPTFAEPPLDRLEATPPAFAEASASARSAMAEGLAGRPAFGATAADPALADLEQWLSAIVADRLQAR